MVKKTGAAEKRLPLTYTEPCNNFFKGLFTETCNFFKGLFSKTCNFFKGLFQTSVNFFLIQEKADTKNCSPPGWRGA